MDQVQKLWDFKIMQKLGIKPNCCGLQNILVNL